MTTAAGIWVPACAGTTASGSCQDRQAECRNRRSKLHLRRLLEHLALLDADVEEILRCESERAREQHGGELLDAGVVFLRRVVEEATRGGDLVFDVGELGLQLLEVLAGLEIGIGLARREQLPQRAGERVLS